ncbi:MAG: hypothetical protein IPP56_13250 [Bacteroidetes bacterium]|nr:hypothetical protein [Bacteroidota bacterium]MBK9800625.1 hypothetical protein [Bacteroidota bacterium]MBP6411989.1 hypothetical protein [Bacteroidia bacterium]
MKKFLLNSFFSIFFLWGMQQLCAQSAPTLVQDTSKKSVDQSSTLNSQNTANTGIQNDTAQRATQKKHSARKATLFSTVLPGLGQAYNTKYWKIPVIYAGFGAMSYFFTINNSRYLKYKKALILRNDDDETTIDDYATQYPNQQTLIEYKDYYRRNRDLSVIGFALFYVLNIVDANVDANLFYFDVSDDLSMEWMPVAIPSSTFASGIGIKLKF